MFRCFVHGHSPATRHVLSLVQYAWSSLYCAAAKPRSAASWLWERAAAVGRRKPPGPARPTRQQRSVPRLSSRCVAVLTVCVHVSELISREPSLGVSPPLPLRAAPDPGDRGHNRRTLLVLILLGEFDNRATGPTSTLTPRAARTRSGGCRAG
ncbi:hypothetical protein JB92DRAFT_2963399 [Gautieria morchelliformis]|nr:hypothetical protein JB92DRAFT_2963399 [Gautieria morchelliformis]